MNNNALIISRTIECLRLPMTILVVYIHCVPSIIAEPVSLSDFSFNLLAITFSDILSGVAVPMFFLISGYLFFYNVENWNFNEYKKKIRKRVKSLILPYIYWIILAVFFFASARYVAYKFAGSPMSEFVNYIDTNVSLHMFWDAYSMPSGTWLFGLFNSPDSVFPSLIPFWFVRNLIVLTIMTPLIYPFVKKWGKIILVVLFLCYVSGVWVQYSPLSIGGFFYFSIGAYFGIHKQNFITVFERFKTAIYIASTIFFIVTLLSSLFNLPQIKSVVSPIFTCSGVLAAICVSSSAVRNGKCEVLIRFAKYSFFIYALHTILILSACKFVIGKISNTLFAFAPSIADIISYLTSPILAVIVCMMVYNILKVLTPKILVALTGERT